jgi:hypothetical protein
MKKIFAGRVYDTDTAERVCELPSARDRGNFSWHETALYRTKAGRFFVAGNGGPRSMWAESAGQNTWRGGQGLRVVDEQEARGYMEAANCSSEDFEAVGMTVEAG